LIDEENFESKRFIALFDNPLHWNLKSSHGMLLRAAHTFVQNKAGIKQLQEFMDANVPRDFVSFYANLSVNMEFQSSGTELMHEYLQWAFKEAKGIGRLDER
jgi:hypothetical protein